MSVMVDGMGITFSYNAKTQRMAGFYLIGTLMTYDEKFRLAAVVISNGVIALLIQKARAKLDATRKKHGRPISYLLGQKAGKLRALCNSRIHDVLSRWRIQR